MLRPDQEDVNAKAVRFGPRRNAPTSNVMRKCDMIPSKAIMPTIQTLSMYNRDTIQPLRKCRIRNPKTNKQYVYDFVVVTDAPTSILASATVQEMGLVTAEYKIRVVKNLWMKPDAKSINGLNKDLTFLGTKTYLKENCVVEGEFHLETGPTIRKVQLSLRKTPVATKNC